MKDRIEVKYNDLQRMGTTFSKSSDSVDRMTNEIRSHMDRLRASWEGVAEKKFFEEMEREVLPALKRLSTAMDRASDTTKQLTQLFQQAETEASSQFKQT